MERAFRLAGLLRLRELEEDRAAGMLALSHGALRAAEQRQEATLTSLAGHAMPGAADPAGWRSSVSARGTLTHLLADAAIDARDAGERVAADAAVWSAARSRSVGLEKLHDAHRTLVAAHDARAEQVVLDEVAARRRSGHAVGAGARPTTASDLLRTGRSLPAPHARTTEGART